MTSSNNNTRELRVNPLITIYYCLRLVLESGHIKPFILTSIWALISAFITFTAIFEKNFYNSAAEMIGNPSSAAFHHTMWWLSVWMGVLLIASFISYYTKRTTAGMWYNCSFFVKERLMWKLGRAKLDYFENTDTYYKLFFVKNNLSDNLANIVSKSFNIISSLLKLFTAAAIIMTDNWIIALTVVVGSIPSIILSSRQTEEQFNNNKQNSIAIRFQDYILILLVKHKFMKEVRFGNLYHYLKNQYEDSVINAHHFQKKTLMKFYYANIGASAFSSLTVFIALAMITFDIYEGKLGIGSFMLVYSCSQSIQGAMTSMFGDYIYISSQGRIVNYYNEVMNFEEEPIRSNKPENKKSFYGTDFKSESKQEVEISNYDIEFKNVSFSYPGSDRLVLDGITVKINFGEKIAIIGENGSGKSTFVSILCGLYQPQSGQVLFGNQDIKEDIGPLRKYISVALQDFGRYNLSLRDQITIGDLSREIDDEEVIEAAKLSGAYDVIRSMNDGLNTHIGVLEKGGTANLSGGQWQKLVTARVLIKKNAKVLILDEPTAALDPVAESKLYKDFSKMTNGRTSLLISHRLGAAKLADRVLVFDKGKIVEQGTHEDLMQIDGLYAKMYRAQSQWYV